MRGCYFLAFLLAAACGGGKSAPVNGGAGDGSAVPANMQQPAPAARDVMPDIRGARDIVFIRESMELPPLEDPAASSLAMRHLEAGVAAGFARFEAELVRTANALSPDLPRMERYRILVMRLDELTGWDRPGVTPWAELDE